MSREGSVASNSRLERLPTPETNYFNGLDSKGQAVFLCLAAGRKSQRRQIEAQFTSPFLGAIEVIQALPCFLKWRASV